MKTINIFGDNRFSEYTKTRVETRGIIVSDGMILLTYEVNTDQWFIPGGGLEGEKSIVGMLYQRACGRNWKDC